MCGGELDFASREPALGSDGKGDGAEPRLHARSRRGIGTGRQNKFDAPRNSLKAGFKRGNCPNEGHDIAAALFSRPDFSSNSYLQSLKVSEAQGFRAFLNKHLL